MNHGLPENAARKICRVLARYPEVAQAILYGSRAKGNYRHGSDIDLTLRGGAALTQGVLYKIIQEIDDLDLPYTIDLSIFADIHDPAVIEHIQRVGVVFYEKAPAHPVSE